MFLPTVELSQNPIVFKNLIRIQLSLQITKKKKILQILTDSSE